MARRRNKKRADDKRGVIIIVVSVLGLLGLIAMLLLVKLTAVPYDDTTFCPTDRAYSHTVIMIDKTDPLTDQQEKALRSIIAQLKAQMELYEKLSIYVLDDRNYSFPEPSFALCNPGTGDDASPIYQNPQLIQRRFEELFGSKLDDALNDIQLGDTRPHSPIMEMIRNLDHLTDYGPENAPRHLILFSDMLQHMPEYSHYRGDFDFSKFEGTDYAALQRIDLQNVDVSIVYLVRDKTVKLQTNRHGLFWEKYFDSLGAELQEIRPIR